MEKQVFRVGDSPTITVSTMGDLVLKGALLPELVIKSDSLEGVNVSGEDEINIQSRDSLVMQVPRDASIIIEKVQGKAVIKGIEGSMTIGEIFSSLVLKDVGQVKIDRVRGDLVAKRIEGRLSIRLVNGNTVIRKVEEDFQVDEDIFGNLVLDDVEGDVDVSVRGNATLRLDPVTGQKYDVKARGNIVCRLPEDASVAVDIARGGNIRIDLKAARISETVRAPYQLTLGDGDAEMRLEAHGNVMLLQRATDWETMDFHNFDMEVEGAAEEISRQVAEQVEAQVEMIEHQIEEQLSSLAASLGASGISKEAADKISQRAREASARATARTQEKMAKVQEKLQRKWEASQRRIEQKARAAEKRAQAREGRSWGAAWPRSSSKPASDPVTEQERLLILQMLAEKKISLEEAEKLLEALEGN
jgi:hypothetical protein